MSVTGFQLRFLTNFLVLSNTSFYVFFVDHQFGQLICVKITDSFHFMISFHNFMISFLHQVFVFNLWFKIILFN